MSDGSPSASAHTPLSPAHLEAVAERFRALASPSRLCLLNALMEGPALMGDLAARTGLEPSNLSRHVAALETAGCVQRTRRGREVQVAISDPSLPALCDLVCRAVEQRAERRLAALRRA